MSSWEGELFSAVALVLGGLLTLSGQRMSDRRRDREQDRAAAFERAQARAADQRTNLYEIQDHMIDLSDAVFALNRPGESQASREASLASVSHATHRLRALVERVARYEIRDILGRYLEVKEAELRAASESDRRVVGVRSAAVFAEAQKLIGSEVRDLG
ncbi:hypothetical protein [Paractinoplanes toevensis]|uniref:Uncharacterized protein n=1 Tax=Paractinoplanes toevensis TaxID=571911 RepID=A0A919W1Z5_9ACTN|nr:hypothetical protein [Actinoplanes toevensis]GIM93017.1 hypothetical protein Ato02nite_048100 [Actinoplanes toevensis]